MRNGWYKVLVFISDEQATDYGVYGTTEEALSMARTMRGVYGKSGRSPRILVQDLQGFCQDIVLN